MTVARLRLAPTGGTATHAKRAGRQSPPTGAPKAPREPPSPTVLAPQKRTWAAPAMSVAAAHTSRAACESAT
jgi:hypothetical protein